MEIHIQPEEAVEEIRSILTGDDDSKIERALLLAEALLSIDRDNEGLVFCMGACYMRQGRYGLAEHWFQRALDMKPEFPEAINNLGFLKQREGDIKGAIEFFNKALEFAPNQPEFLNNAATAYVNNGTPEKAIEMCDKVLAQNPEHKDAAWNKSLALLELGRWAEGWDLYKYGLVKNVASSQNRKLREYGEPGRIPYWEGQKGKIVAIYGEQGVGDEIMATSMLEDLCKDCAHVIYEAHPRLMSIMRHSFEHIPNLTIYGTRKENWRELAWVEWHELDYKLPILQLGQFYRRSAEAFPKKVYLKPYEDKVEKYKAKLAALGPKPKIGISWKGGSGTTRFDLRSLSLPAFVPLMRSIDADWISLQYDPADRPTLNEHVVAHTKEQMGDFNLHHWPDIINDLDEDYGGLIHCLDLIVSVNTSLVHACGAYGVRCWTLTPSKPAWRYGVVGDEMPWYGSWVKQIRQQGDDWDSVLEGLKTSIPAYLAEEKAA